MKVKVYLEAGMRVRHVVKTWMEAGTRVHCLSYCTLEYDKSTTHDIKCMGLAV